MKISLTLPPIRIDSDILEKANIPKLLQQEMESVRTEIIQSTTAGQTVDGSRSLKTYSESYKHAIDSGRIAGKAPGNYTPNLTATGQLMRSMKITNMPNGATMTFEGSHAPARRVSAGGASRKRSQTLARSTKLRGIGPQKDRKAKGEHKTGKSVPNATIAQAQYDMGRTGWVAFSAKAFQRIEKAVADKLAAVFKSLITQ